MSMSIMKLSNAQQQHLHSHEGREYYGFMLDYIDNALRAGEYKMNRLTGGIDLQKLIIEAKIAFKKFKNVGV